MGTLLLWHRWTGYRGAETFSIAVKPLIEGSRFPWLLKVIKIVKSVKDYLGFKSIKDLKINDIMNHFF